MGKINPTGGRNAQGIGPSSQVLDTPPKLQKQKAALHAHLYEDRNWNLQQLHSFIPSLGQDQTYNKTLNQKLNEINVRRIKSTLIAAMWTEDEKTYAANFINSLHNPVLAYEWLAKLQAAENCHGKLIALFKAAKKHDLLKNKYQNFVAYAVLYDVVVNAVADNDVGDELIDFEMLLEAQKDKAILEEWLKIKRINFEKNNIVPWVLYVCASLSIFLALEVMLAIVNHLLFDSANYLEFGEISDGSFQLIATPIILVLSVIFGYSMSRLNYASCSDGAHAHYLERIASRSDNFDFDSPINREKLGFWYYAHTRFIINVLPFFTMLGVLATFELILFELASINDSHLMTRDLTLLNDIQATPYLFLAAAIALALIHYNRDQRDVEQSPFTSSFTISCALVFVALSVMPLLGLDYNAMRLLYGAFTVVCSTLYASAYTLETADVLRAADHNQLNKLENARSEQEVFLHNECTSYVKSTLLNSRYKSNADDNEIETDLKPKSLSI